LLSRARARRAPIPATSVGSATLSSRLGGAAAADRRSLGAMVPAPLPRFLAALLSAGARAAQITFMEVNFCWRPLHPTNSSAIIGLR